MNPTDDGDFGKGEFKDDCPRPMAGCRYPKCDCDVSEEAIEKIAEQMKERDYEDIDPEKYMKDNSEKYEQEYEEGEYEMTLEEYVEYREELRDRFLDSI